jgi:hypothetical protein
MVKTIIETFQLVQVSHGNNAFSCIRILEWFATVLDGCENLKDDEWGGQPTAI